MVDLPDPELPTNAITAPAGASKLTLCITCFPSSYPNETSLNDILPLYGRNVPYKDEQTNL